MIHPLLQYCRPAPRRDVPILVNIMWRCMAATWICPFEQPRPNQVGIFTIRAEGTLSGRLPLSFAFHGTATSFLRRLREAVAVDRDFPPSVRLARRSFEVEF